LFCHQKRKERGCGGGKATEQNSLASLALRRHLASESVIFVYRVSLFWRRRGRCEVRAAKLKCAAQPVPAYAYSLGVPPAQCGSTDRHEAVSTSKPPNAYTRLTQRVELLKIVSGSKEQEKLSRSMKTLTLLRIDAVMAVFPSVIQAHSPNNNNPL